MKIFTITIVVIVSCIVLYSIELLFGYIFALRPHQGSIERFRKIADSLEPKEFKKRRRRKKILDFFKNKGF